MFVSHLDYLQCSSSRSTLNPTISHLLTFFHQILYTLSIKLFEGLVFLLVVHFTDADMAINCFRHLWVPQFHKIWILVSNEYSYHFIYDEIRFCFSLNLLDFHSLYRNPYYLVNLYGGSGNLMELCFFFY